MRRHSRYEEPLDHPEYGDTLDYPEYDRRSSPPAQLGVGRGTAVALAAGLLLLGANVLAGRRREHRIDRMSAYPDNAPDHARLVNLDTRAHVGRSVTINRPRQELYAYWRDFDNLPKFMSNVEKVERLDGDRSVWTISAPGGSVQLASEITEDRPGEVIAWRTLPDSAVQADGRISFRDAPGNRGTIVEARIVYEPPAGDLGRWIAKLFRKEPDIQGRHELKRFKMLMETGEIATSHNRIHS